jgi:hypothetical protein
MDGQYDIFERFPDGKIVWRTFIPGLKSAVVLLTEFGKLSSTQFFAYHAATKEIVAWVNYPGIRRAASA